MKTHVNKKFLYMNGHKIDFDFEIQKVIEWKDSVIILVDIPYSDKNSINNIYAFNEDGTFKWRVEDLRNRFPNMQGFLPYLSLRLNDGMLAANDFMGRRYFISPDTGHIERVTITK